MAGRSLASAKNQMLEEKGDTAPSDLAGRGNPGAVNE